MNCLNPITIVNPTKRYARGISKAVLTVPCGKCEHCRAQRIQDWTIRIYEMMQKYEQEGGYTIFPTLTYDNEHLPFLTVSNETTFSFTPQQFKDGEFGGLEFNGIDSPRDIRRKLRSLMELSNGKYRYTPSRLVIPSFDRDHIKKFMNSLRKHFERLGIIGLTMFVACEYGEEKKRPHYHVLIHCPECGISPEELQRLIQHYWQYGLVMYSELGAVVNTFAAARYVAKYICKDLDFYSRIDVDSVEADYREFLRTGDNLSPEASYWQFVKRFMPTHWQSKFYGFSMYKRLSDYDTEKLFDVLLNGVRIPLTEMRFQVPQYIRNKILYKLDDSGSRILSELGLKFARYRFDHDIETISKKLQEEVSVRGICQYLSRDEDVYEIKGLDMSVQGINDLSRKLKSLMDGYSFEDLALYKRVYMGFVPDTDSRIQLMMEYSTRDLLDMAYDIYMYRYDNQVLEDTEYFDLDSDERKWQAIEVYDTLPQFLKFATLFNLLDQIHHIKLQRKADFQVSMSRTIDKIRALHGKKY